MTVTLGHCLPTARVGWVHESPGEGAEETVVQLEVSSVLHLWGTRGRTSLCSRMRFVCIKYKESVELGMEIIEGKGQPRSSRENVWGGEGW